MLFGPCLTPLNSTSDCRKWNNRRYCAGLVPPKPLWRKNWILPMGASFSCPSCRLARGPWAHVLSPGWGRTLAGRLACVCVCARTCVCLGACIHMCAHMCAYVCECVCMLLCTFMCMCVHVYVCVNGHCVPMYMCMCMHVHMCASVCVHVAIGLHLLSTVYFLLFSFLFTWSVFFILRYFSHWLQLLTTNLM